MSNYKVFPTQLIDFWTLEITEIKLEIRNQADFKISYMIWQVSDPRFETLAGLQ